MKTVELRPISKFTEGVNGSICISPKFWGWGLMQGREAAKLSQDLAKEQAKLSPLQSKIISAKSAISATKYRGTTIRIARTSDPIISLLSDFAKIRIPMPIGIRTSSDQRKSLSLRKNIFFTVAM